MAVDKLKEQKKCKVLNKNCTRLLLDLSTLHRLLATVCYMHNFQIFATLLNDKELIYSLDQEIRNLLVALKHWFTLCTLFFYLTVNQILYLWQRSYRHLSFQALQALKIQIIYCQSKHFSPESNYDLRGAGPKLSSASIFNSFKTCSFKTGLRSYIFADMF